MTNRIEIVKNDDYYFI